MHASGDRSWLELALLCLLALPIAARSADAPPLILEHLSTQEGLPQGTVYASLQDTQGFVWLATEDGLVRYDGHELFRYAYAASAHSGLPGNFVRDIVEDSHHDLWIAIKDAGIARWNRVTDSFTVYRHDPTNPASLASDATRVVRIDPRGRVWIGMEDAGVDALDPVTGRIEHFRHDSANPDSLSDDRTFTLAVDHSGALWLGTASGLDRWQPERNGFTHYRNNPADPHTLSGKQVSQVVEDRQGYLWVGSFDGGLDRMDRGGHVLDSFRHDPQRATSLGSDDVRAVLEDHAGHVWIGTSEGLDLLDRATGRFWHYRHDETDAGSLRDSSIMSLYEDSSGLVWIGTRSGGVSRWNPRSWEFGGRRPDWLHGTSVLSFADSTDGKVWIASMGAGLALFDDASGEITDIDRITGKKNFIGDKRVMALRTDRRGTLWIGTMTRGLNKLGADGRLEKIPVKVGDPRSTSSEGIMTLFEARDGRLWVGTHDGGVNVLDPATGLIRQLPYNGTVPGAISAASVTAIAEDLQGNVWMGTDSGGLNLARPDGSVVKVFRHDPSDANSIPANTILAIAVDGEGRVWVGTDGGGLARAIGSASAPDSIRFEVLSREQGLSSDTIYGILSDSQGHLWLSGNAGLMRVDPGTRVVKTYHREHGLQGEEFESNAYYRLHDGRLCFGGPGGFNVFDPSRLTETNRAPRIALTGLEVLGVPVHSATPYWRLDRIKLDYRDSIVSMDFATLDFTSPKHNRLAYRIATLSDQWIDLGTQHRITLTNLDSGDHLLEVRAANADSVWSEPPLRLVMHRNSAPWRSPWAYALYATILLLLVMHRMRAHRRKLQSMVRAKERLESEVAMRTHELVESNQQLAEASQAKSNFLARMSHELRTPMNGVLGMTELLGRTAQTPAQARLTKTISSSAHVLLQIVNDLLDLSKMQAGKIELETLPLDLVQLLEECTMLFAGTAETKGIDLTVIPPLLDASNLLGDALRIRQIVMNLVGNAVKFTMQGEVVVKADLGSVVEGCTSLQITVSDTGVGMDTAALDKIFEPFTQADESTTRRFGGSGLGLAICKEIAERMGGTITVESRLAGGSTFVVTLPLKTSAAASLREPSPLAQRTVRILTRRPALAQALGRYVSGLGARLSECDDPGQNPAQGEIAIADLGHYASLIRSTLNAASASRLPLVIVGTAAQIADLQAERPVDAAITIVKPVQRELLRQALTAAVDERKTIDPKTAAFMAEPAIGGHVLLVEDEPVNAAVAQGYLAELGCTSVWVNNGPEAVARSASERFDLIMMDLNMPTMDGFATTKLIRKSEGTRGRVPIIAITAHDAKSHRDSCIRAGMDDHMNKPYTLAQCAEVLRRWISGSAEANSPNYNSIGTHSESPSDVQQLSAVDAKTIAGLRSLRADGNSDLYSKLVDLFRSASTETMNQLKSAVERGDLHAASAACHKLSASAANVGALAFAQDARQLERICTEHDLARARRICEKLTSAHPALIDELRRLQMRASA